MTIRTRLTDPRLLENQAVPAQQTEGAKPVSPPTLPTDIDPTAVRLAAASGTENQVARSSGRSNPMLAAQWRGDVGTPLGSARRAACRAQGHH
ncbi:MAG: hypothetical protein ACAI38_11700 [Myxococcota bacterium]